MKDTPKHDDQEDRAKRSSVDQHEQDESDEGDHGKSKPKLVTISVNALEVKIAKGDESGLAIKQAAGCPSTYVLERVPGLEEVANDQVIKIKGGEEFVCHQPMGQVS